LPPTFALNTQGTKGKGREGRHRNKKKTVSVETANDGGGYLYSRGNHVAIRKTLMMARVVEGDIDPSAANRPQDDKILLALVLLKTIFALLPGCERPQGGFV
jgi:hypothetical protein